MIKKKLLSLILAICMVMVLAPTIAFADGDAPPVQIEVKNAQNGRTEYKVGDGNWIELNASQVYDISDVSNGEIITVHAIPNEGQQLDGAEFWKDGFQENQEVDNNALQTEDGWSFTYDGSKKYKVCVTYRDGGDNPIPDNPPSASSGELVFTCQDNKLTGGSIYYKLNNSGEFIQVSEDEENGQYNAIPLTEEATSIAIRFEVNEGYQLDTVRGVTLRVNGADEFNSTNENNADFIYAAFTSDSGYTFNLSELVGEGSVSESSFELEFGFIINGGNEPTWHTVSWDGGNVTVEHGTVKAERVHLGDKIFTVNKEESDESDSDEIYPIDDLIGEEGQEGFGPYGLGYGDTDLFIDNSVNETVSIDFKFVPDYGYQLSDILTNETDSLLNDFTASASEISTFNFEVRPDGGNVHFNVVFTEVEDTIDTTNSSVTEVSIANGNNATDSGNLKMTVADVQEGEVSQELKDQAGENALYLDMNLYQVVSKGGENGDWENQLKELNDPITVILNIPAPAEDSSYYVVREHGDGDNKTCERIDVTFEPDENNSDMGTVMFETDKFSTYAIATRSHIEDRSVDKSSVSVACKMTVKNITTNETASLPIRTLYPSEDEDVVVASVAGIRDRLIEEAKTFLKDYVDVFGAENTSIEVVAVEGEPVVTGATTPFDNRTYTMKNAGTSDWYKLIEGDYGKTADYTVTLTVKVQEVGDNHSHNLTLVPAKDSTCTEAGNKAYYTCNCGAWFEDATGAVEITDKSSVIIPAKGHTASDWKSDADNHWKVCNVVGCGVIIEGSKAAHSYGDDNVCDICGYTESVTPSSYDFLEGANGSWAQNSNGTLTFRANGEFSKFTGVKVDGTLVDEKNYTAVSGSTIVTFKEDYLKTLSGGTHSLTVLFKDGECSTNFEVKAAQTENGGGSASEKSPKTGDNSNLALWFALLFVSGAGTLGTVVYSKRRKRAE